MGGFPYLAPDANGKDDMGKIDLLGISGSLREGSFNRKLMREAARIYGAENFVEADLRLPLYDGDLEDDTGIPDQVATLHDQITRADAILIATPEYNQSFSGVLKNALDWVSRVKPNPWADKPVAIMSAAAGRAGGARAQFALRLAMVPFRPHLVTGPEIMVASAEGQFEGGDLTTDSYLKTLNTLMTRTRAQVDGRGDQA